MKVRIQYKDIEYNGNFEEYVVAPKECPMCNASFGGKYIFAHRAPQYDTDNNTILAYQTYVTYHCNNCGKSFLAIYNSKVHNGETLNSQLFDLAPKTIRKESFQPEIEQLSPKFVDIYNEALYAEKSNLNEICSLGYRKALEFLVKDYLIKMKPNEIEKISKMPLSTAILQKIDNPKIKVLAERCAWLGNDEAHYIRKHNNYDVSNLKDFLKTMVSFIECELLVEKALQIERK